MQGKRGARLALLAAGAMIASAVGYSVVEAPQSMAQGDGGSSYECKLPDSVSLGVRHTDDGVYVLDVPEIKLKGDNEGCKEPLEAHKVDEKEDTGGIRMEDNRPTFEASDGSCEVKVDKVITDGNFFENGGGELTAKLDDKGKIAKKPADLKITADITDKASKSQRNHSASLAGKVSGLTGECEEGKFQPSTTKVTVKLNEGVIKFTPKS